MKAKIVNESIEDFLNEEEKGKSPYILKNEKPLSIEDAININKKDWKWIDLGTKEGDFYSDYYTNGSQVIRIDINGNTFIRK